MSGQTPASPLQLNLGQIRAVLIKAKAEPDFAKKLHDDPSAAVQSLGYPVPNPQEIAFFAKLGAAEYDTHATHIASKNPDHTLAEL
jgi:hypothetical protein